jgi:hypothetical protein
VSPYCGDPALYGVQRSICLAFEDEKHITPCELINLPSWEDLCIFVFALRLERKAGALSFDCPGICQVPSHLLLCRAEHCSATAHPLGSLKLISAVRVGTTQVGLFHKKQAGLFFYLKIFP